MARIATKQDWYGYIMNRSNLVGKTIGPYRLKEQIGEGSSAYVFLAYKKDDASLKVALKVLRQHQVSDSNRIKRFFRQAKVQQKLQNSNILKIYDYNQDGQWHYIAMEYASGGSLKDLLAKNGPLEPQQAAAILSQIASALDYAHTRGVYHRDVKPANILLSADQSKAYLTDFGIARIVGTKTLRGKKKHAVIGTPQYMSPEQVQQGVIDGRSDIYNLGMTLYITLTGKLPFNNDPVPLILSHQVSKNHYPIRQIDPNIPIRFEQIVDRALQKDPKKRFQNAGQVQRALNGQVWPFSFLYLSTSLLIILICIIVFVFARAYIFDSAPTSEATPIAEVTANIITAESSPVSGPPTSTIAPTVPITPTSILLTSTEPPRRGPVTRTPTRTRTPTPTTDSSTAARPLVQALSPNTFVVNGSHPVNLQWEWEGTLASDECFQLRFQHRETGKIESPSPAWVRNRSATVDLVDLQRTGTYSFQIAVVTGCRSANLVLVDEQSSDPIFITIQRGG